MKKRSILLILSSGFLVCSLTSCTFPSSITHTTKNVIYFNPETVEGIETKFDFFSHNPYVPYIPIKDYQSYISSYTMSVKQNGNNFTFTNLLNNSKAYLNAYSGELKYDSYSKFTSTSEIPHQEIAYSATYSKRVDDESRYQEGHTYTINLNDYNLYPMKDGNNYYLPLDVMMRIDPLTNKGTTYYDGDSLVSVIYASNYNTYKEYFKEHIVSSYPKSFYEYGYDLFTFDVDLNFGLTNYSRPMRSNDNKPFTFNQNKSRKTFEQYKSNIINSSSIEEYDSNFNKMFDELEDGGHSRIEKISLGSGTALERNHKEYNYTNDRLVEESKKRNAAEKQEKLFESVASFEESGKEGIGYVTLNEFTTIGIDSIHDVLKNANKQFNKKVSGQDNIKHVVIDIAYNGGGATAAEGALLSWICDGKARQILKDANDDSITKSVYQYNIDDIDGFDEKDYLPNDVKIYILTDATFSAANALAFDTYMYTLTDEYKKSNKDIKFIGKPGLGGACSITNKIVSPTGLTYVLSSNAVGIDWNDNSKTCDEILPISEGWEMSVDQIINRTGYINPKIRGEL